MPTNNSTTTPGEETRTFVSTTGGFGPYYPTTDSNGEAGFYVEVDGEGYLVVLTPIDEEVTVELITEQAAAATGTTLEEVVAERIAEPPMQEQEPQQEEADPKKKKSMLHQEQQQQQEEEK